MLQTHCGIICVFFRRISYIEDLESIMAKNYLDHVTVDSNLL